MSLDGEEVVGSRSAERGSIGLAIEVLTTERACSQANGQTQYL